MSSGTVHGPATSPRSPGPSSAAVRYEPDAGSSRKLCSTGARSPEGGVVPWADVEVVELCRVGGHVHALGVRMRDPLRYAATLTDEERERMLVRIRAVRGLGASASVAEVTDYYSWQLRPGGRHMLWTQEVMNHWIDDVLRRCERLHDAAN